MDMIKTLDPKQDIVNLIKRFVQSHIQALQLSTKRVKEILSGRLSLDLVDAIECLSQESNFFLTACKFVVGHPGSIEAKETLVTCQERIYREYDRVVRIVSCKDADDFYKKVCAFGFNCRKVKLGIIGTLSYEMYCCPRQ
jgi:hypothetical protein